MSTTGWARSRARNAAPKATAAEKALRDLMALDTKSAPKRNKGRRRGDRTTPRKALHLYWPDRVARA